MSIFLVKFITNAYHGWGVTAMMHKVLLSLASSPSSLPRCSDGPVAPLDIFLHCKQVHMSPTTPF